MQLSSQLWASRPRHDALAAAAVTEDMPLVHSGQAVDVQTYNLLVERYQGRLYALCYRILGDADAAADVTQDVFLADFLHLQQYRGGSFQAWLLRIATNRCYDQIRARKRRPQTSLEALGPEGEELSQHLTDPSETPEARVLRDEVAEKIQD